MQDPPPAAEEIEETQEPDTQQDSAPPEPSQAVPDPAPPAAAIPKPQLNVDYEASFLEDETPRSGASKIRQAPL